MCLDPKELGQFDNRSKMHQKCLIKAGATVFQNCPAPESLYKLSMHSQYRNSFTSHELNLEILMAPGSTQLRVA